MIPRVWNAEKKRFHYHKITPLAAEQNAAELIEPMNPKWKLFGEFVSVTSPTTHYNSDQHCARYNDFLSPPLRRDPSEYTKCGVIVCPDQYGLSPNLIQFCDRLALEGLIVIMPDLSQKCKTFPYANESRVYVWPPKDLKPYLEHAENTSWSKVKPDIDFCVTFLKLWRYCKKYTVVGIGWGAAAATRIAGDRQFSALALVSPSHVTKELAFDVKCPVLVVDGGPTMNTSSNPNIPLDETGREIDNDVDWASPKVVKALLHSEGGGKYGVCRESIEWVGNHFLSGVANFSDPDTAQAAGEATELVAAFLKRYMYKKPKEFVVLDMGKLQPTKDNITQSIEKARKNAKLPTEDFVSIGTHNV
ncbi:hypothetical protein AAMO2058_000655300 [Amorphochlora amoebiformis]